MSRFPYCLLACLSDTNACLICLLADPRFIVYFLDYLLTVCSSYCGHMFTLFIGLFPHTPCWDCGCMLQRLILRVVIGEQVATLGICCLLFAQIIGVVCSNQIATSNICYLAEEWLLLYNSWLLCLCNSWLLSLCNSWLAWKSWLNNFVCWFQGARAASARQGAGAASALQGAAG